MSSSLYQRLREGVITGNPQSDDDSLVSMFLPGDVLAKEVNSDSIAASLSWSDWFLSRWSNHLPIHASSRCPRVFAVLVLIGQERAIKNLISQDDITDDDLPLSCDHPGRASVVSLKTGKSFSSLKSWPPSSLDAFLEKQWVVLAPILKTGQHSALVQSQPLPITRSNLVNYQGGRVFIHQAFFHPHHADFSAPGLPFAVKEFRDSRTFHREKSVLDRTAGLAAQHLARLLTSFETPSSYYLVFKWADGGDLAEFWRREDSLPRTADLVRWVLQQILGLVEALRLLHEINIRHGDIKPGNILLFTQDESGPGKLVLQDLGISRHHRQNTGLRHQATLTAETTLGYEAPEAEKSHPHYDKPRSRAYDMWSLGCVWLEFIVWLLYSYEGVETFRRRRETAGHSTDYRDPFAAFFNRGTMDLHPVVTRALVKMREHPLCGPDKAIGDLLTLIETRLLHTDPSQRTTASELHTELCRIFQRAQDDPSYLGYQSMAFQKNPGFFRKSTRKRIPSDVPSIQPSLRTQVREILWFSSFA